jgi:transcriptional regulator with XRE-family HTH domain
MTARTFLPSSSARRIELATFLRARRARLQPEDVGLARARRRLTPGLRREEVAALAGVGLTWYTWLEQGRDIQVSSATLQNIARALRLSASDEIYVSTLAGTSTSATISEIGHRRESAELDATSAFLQSVTKSIAMVLDARLDVVAFNRLADATFSFAELDGPFSRNHVWRAFMDPQRRRVYPAFDAHIPSFVGLLRVRYASHVGDPAFEDLLDALRTKSAEFDRMWSAQATAPLDYAPTSSLRAPGIGTIHGRSVRFTLPNHPEHALFAIVAADGRTEAKLARAHRMLEERGSSSSE